MSLTTPDADPLPPRYILVYERAYQVQAQFSGPDYMAQANAYMERHSNVGLLSEVDGTAYLADKDDKGILVPGSRDRPRSLTCCCCGGGASGRQWWNRDAGYGLCTGCIEYCTRGESIASFQSNYGLRGIHYDIQ